MKIRSIFSVAHTGLLFTLLLPYTLLHGQPPAPPTLEAILQQLQSNLDRYDATIPSLFCDEHVVSSVTPSLQGQNDTVTDSIFRLKRVTEDRVPVLQESREVKTVNGHPADERDIEGPSILTGAFEGGLALVTAGQSSCMNYSLERIKKHRPYTIHFASVLTPQNKASCLLQEEGNGKVYVDPATMQITRMQLTTPHHLILPAGYNRPAVTGKWVVDVVYRPVDLDGQTFWMPSTISSQTIGGGGSFHPIIWLFRATYRNFHRLEVKSRILPPADTPPS